MKEIPNVLVVCGRNKRRSKTAEKIFRNSNEFHIQSAGLSPRSPSQINESRISWADVILVMEDEHKSRILKQYRHLDIPPLFVLHIEDDFEFMQAELVEILQEKIPDVLKHEFNL